MDKPRIFPAALQLKADALPVGSRITTSHEQNWIAAAKGEGKSSSPFESASPLTEVMLLGIVALRAGQGRTILYDAANMTITNAPEANQYLTRVYRQGWAL